MSTKQISIASLVITEFRKFSNTQVDFAKPITLIAGQNGTAKSTLLGMLAQPFSFGSQKDKEKLDASAYLSNYHNMRLSECVDIAGNFYTYPCDKIFRLSKKHDTPNKRYVYETRLKGLDFAIDKASPLKAKRLLTVNQARDKKLRFVTGPALQNSDSVSHNSGEGNFPHPVIYLSLGRLLPLAEVNSCEILQGAGKLGEEESVWYVRAYKSIFSVIDERPDSGLMDTREKKRSIVPLTESYDGESCSAGQDNIGRLLTAVLSFQRLKEHLGDCYRGGLLLIDEIDATLHPASQIKLLDFLCKEAKRLCIQIVATTHSLCLLEHCLRKHKKDVGVVHIKKVNGTLIINSNATGDDIQANLKNVAIKPPKQHRKTKVSVVLEDGEAVKLFKFLTSKMPDLRKRLCIANIKGKSNKGKAKSLSGEYLRIFSENASKIPELENVIFVPDADMGWAKEDKGKKNGRRNVVPLPGEKAIEIQIFELLQRMPETDPFWNQCLGVNYCKQVAIGNYTDIDLSSIDDVKKWYKEQTSFWGKGCSIVFKRYYQEYSIACENFLSRLEQITVRCEQNLRHS